VRPGALLHTSRRGLLRAAGLAAAAAAFGRAVTALAQPSDGAAPRGGPAQPPEGTRALQSGRWRTRLVLLGTKGGPRPGVGRQAPAQVILIDEVPYVIDCGNGIAWQLVRAGVPLERLRNVFITHQHSDHNADYGNLLLLAWAAGLRNAVDTYGPAPLARMTRLFMEMDAEDIGIRMADEGRPSLPALVRPHEIETEGLVMQDERVRVRAVRVRHPPFATALAYRFDAPDRSIVISGDTAYSEALIGLAQGADVLVHEAMYLPGIEAMIRRVPNAARLREHLLASHTSTEDAGRVAERAGVGQLVLSHLVPGDDPSISEAQWTEGARAHFRGPVILGRDLMEI
jgi:ribonuclease BN (tRNA processing enzyme)